MLAKCYLCGNETDEFSIIETNPEIAICFDCEESYIRKRKKLNQKVKKLNNFQQILKGGETHGNQR